MVQYIEKYKRNIAIDMRKHGFSYSEIQNKMGVPKSTLASWVKDVKLTDEQKENLKSRQIEIARNNIKRRILRTSRLIEEIKSSSSKNVKEISKRELWLLGIILYWKSKNKNDTKNGVWFTSSDPYQIKLFLKWLKEVGGIVEEEIKFDVFISHRQKESTEGIIKFWSKVTGFSSRNFNHIYIQKKRVGKAVKKRKSNKTECGLLRVRVKSSSLLARQIAGWVEAIQNQI